MSAMATNTPPAPPVMLWNPTLDPHKMCSDEKPQPVCLNTQTPGQIVFFLCWYYLVYYDLKMVPGTVLSRRAEAERWYWFVKSEWEDLGNRMEEKEREHWQHALQNNYLKITSVWKQPGLCLILENIQTSMRFWDIACKTMNIWPAWKYQTSKKFTWLSTNTHFTIHMHNQL